MCADGRFRLPSQVNLVPVGLRNVRNVCFLNAILQCLYYTPMLRRSLALAFESRPLRQKHLQHQALTVSLVFEKGAVVKDEWLVALRQLFKELDSARSSKACVAATQMASLMQSASTNGASLQKLTFKPGVCVCVRACCPNLYTLIHVSAPRVRSGRRVSTRRTSRCP